MDSRVDLSCPRSWGDLSQEQLRYVFWLLATFADGVVVKTYMLVRFTGIGVLRRSRLGWKCTWRPPGGGGRKVFYLHTWQLHSMLRQLSWVDSLEAMDNRLDVVQGLTAVHPLLQEDAATKRSVTFADYLCMEKQYQLFHSTRDGSHIDKLASLLYRRPDFSRPDSLELTPAERLATLAWYAHVKAVMARAFPHLFRRAEGEADTSPLAVLQATNTQLRALTDGDVTKEPAVLRTDCWRALTELDAKAREAAELRAARAKP